MPSTLRVTRLRDGTLGSVAAELLLRTLSAHWPCHVEGKPCMAQAMGDSTMPCAFCRQLRACRYAERHHDSN